jgi:aldehyde dehydrogenase
VIETIDNGKPIRETKAADMPLAVDHFRYFAGVRCARRKAASRRSTRTPSPTTSTSRSAWSADHPVELPAADGGVEARARAGRGQLRRAQAGRADAGLDHGVHGADRRPAAAGVVNVVQGFGVEAGKPLASSPRVAKVAFTGETTTGRLIMQYASENLIPVTLELGGKSPNIFLADVMDADDDFFDKALEGFTMFALNQGEVCTCPSRALVHESIYDRSWSAPSSARSDRRGQPAGPATMIGAQASNDQLEKILSYIDIGRRKAPAVLTGGERRVHEGELADGYYVQPTIFEGHNRMRSSRRRSSDRSSRSRGSRTSTRRSRSPTTRSTAWAPASGRAT